jgi:hypothetical protein
MKGIIIMTQEEILNDWWTEMAETGNEDYSDYLQESGLYEGLDNFDAENITTL